MEYVHSALGSGCAHCSSVLNGRPTPATAAAMPCALGAQSLAATGRCRSAAIRRGGGPETRAEALGLSEEVVRSKESEVISRQSLELSRFSPPREL